MLSRSTHLRVFFVLFVFLAPSLVSIVSAVVSLATSFSVLGKGIAVGLVAAVLLICALWLRPILLPTLSGRRLLEAIHQEGLEDVIGRDRELHTRPPSGIFAPSLHEQVICGYTAYGTFKYLGQEVDEFLRDSRHHLYVLILDPGSSPRLSVNWSDW